MSHTERRAKIQPFEIVRSEHEQGQPKKLPLAVSVTLIDLQSDCTSENAQLAETYLKKLFGRSPQASYTDRATAACQRS
jgi:hypothetical protein